jgi:hypothetical protein
VPVELAEALRASARDSLELRARRGGEGPASGLRPKEEAVPSEQLRAGGRGGAARGGPNEEPGRSKSLPAAAPLLKKE